MRLLFQRSVGMVVIQKGVEWGERVSSMVVEHITQDLNQGLVGYQVKEGKGKESGNGRSFMFVEGRWSSSVRGG